MDAEEESGKGRYENQSEDEGQIGIWAPRGSKKEEVMPKANTVYYNTRKDAEAVRRKGDRIYYSSTKGYYIVKIENPFWGR